MCSEQQPQKENQEGKQKGRSLLRKMKRKSMLVLTKCSHVNVSGKRPVGRGRFQGMSY